MKIKIEFIFGRMSKAGYRHYNLVSLSVGSNRFGIVLLGFLITVRFKNKK